MADNDKVILSEEPQQVRINIQDPNKPKPVSVQKIPQKPSLVDRAISGYFGQDVNRKNLGDFIVNLFQFIADSISYIVAAVIIFALVFIVVRLKPRFSMESVEEEKEAAEIDYNSIYNHNYRKEIDDLVTKHDYKGAIRLLYLCTLHSMNESGVVKWDEAKTPTEYYYELKRDNLKSCFFRVTSVFLNVVYGNSQADADLYAQVDADTRAIVKCLTPVIK